MLAHTPLEMAYCWVLACRAALDGVIDFTGGTEVPFRFKPQNIEHARIFQDDDVESFSIAHLRPNVMYYVLEREGHVSHPLSDLFFLSESPDGQIFRLAFQTLSV